MQTVSQVSPLCTTLRGILRDYSQNSVLNEMLQNADDAQAKEFKVCLDCRKSAYGSKTLLGPEMAHFQGPALYCFDDAEFQETDLESILNIGDGNKKGNGA